MEEHDTQIFPALRVRCVPPLSNSVQRHWQEVHVVNFRPELNWSRWRCGAIYRWTVRFHRPLFDTFHHVRHVFDLLRSTNLPVQNCVSQTACRALSSKMEFGPGRLKTQQYKTRDGRKVTLENVVYYVLENAGRKKQDLEMRECPLWNAKTHSAICKRPVSSVYLSLRVFALSSGAAAVEVSSRFIQSVYYLISKFNGTIFLNWTLGIQILYLHVLILCSFWSQSRWWRGQFRCSIVYPSAFCS